jgi:hypothetical protein
MFGWFIRPNYLQTVRFRSCLEIIGEKTSKSKLYITNSVSLDHLIVERKVQSNSIKLDEKPIRNQVKFE